ncbi:MAG: cupin [Comamonas sp. SCN 65-56]|uniref:cupin domain-containing protein n=1 Tax=Comamonas sp. SCN 65-56 TaxID=1660095 RepID=UPI00086DAFE8|nr:cupin domain-containing protein [Comamonas sp. SCN 65-56]ODS93547.1 MAG: cupin [Comamonas sp. SCN 65-56]
MRLNADTSQRAVIHSAELPWLASPLPGVERRMLAREGDEVAVATSLVRYAPGSRFSRHAHELGEEFFVLEGEFCDESGSYGVGTYVRNPPGSSHAPWSVTGCTIFVKLRQMLTHDRQRVVVDTRSAHWQPGLVPGLSVMPLATFETRHTALVRWSPGTHFQTHRHAGGEEILVLAGTFEDEHGCYPQGTWLRNPHLSEHRPFSTQGCTLLVKTGHLAPTEDGRSGAESHLHAARH